MIVVNAWKSKGYTQCFAAKNGWHAISKAQLLSALCWKIYK